MTACRCLVTSDSIIAPALLQQTHQLICPSDFDDVEPVVPHVLLKLDSLTLQLPLARHRVLCVLIHQTAGGGVLPHHVLEHEADIVAQDAEHAVQVHAVLPGMPEISSRRDSFTWLHAVVQAPQENATMICPCVAESMPGTWHA